jgi:hypothetical protein
MTRSAVCVVSCFVAFLSAVGAAHAQTPGQIPVFVDTSGTLGDSTLTQDSLGNVSLTNATAGWVLSVTNTNGDFGYSAIVGRNLNGNGVTGVTNRVGSSGVYGRDEETGQGVGVTGDSPHGIGVFGVSQDGTGVFAASTAGTGVQGVSYTNGAGVVGYSPNGIGVLGQSDNGYAGRFTGLVAVGALGSAGNTALCRNSQSEIAVCSSSLRYKTDVRPFVGGLDIVSRMRPIAFTWKQDGMQDVGLGAEDVERVEPLLTFRNDEGEIEGVKYNQLSAVFVNAIRDQQAQIERQQVQIEALKGLVCQSHPDADVCR